MKYKFRKHISFAMLAAAGVMATGCNDWLGEESPGVIEVEDFFTVGETCVQVINGCYTPLAWEYGSTYFDEWYIGDIASDDAVKGGQDLSDGKDAYDIDNFKVNANNAILLDYYRAKYQGIIRCNLALKQIAEYQPDESLTESRRNCLLGEAHFLRALYYFQLVRVYGGVPLVNDIIDSADRWQQDRASREEIYAAIVNDLQQAEALLWNKRDYADEDLGRATKGAACALLAKVHLYNHDYNQAYTWAKKFIDEHYTPGHYSLCPVYADNFTLAGENGPESIFEIQYMEDPTSDYGGFGFTRGTFSQILTRPRGSMLGSNSGWGFNHPTQNLYDEYESGDARREVSIGVPAEEYRDEVEVNYLGNYYFNNKTSMSEGGTFPALAHASRGPLNYILLRTADALLVYAEASLESGKDLNAAKWALEEVRSRARANATEPGALPQFPGYRGYSDNQESLRDAIRHERRVELAMEGQRWFDLVRWGIAAKVMDKTNGTYGKTENADLRDEMATFIPGKHELFPIPAEEINLNPMAQNPGY